MFDLLYHLAEFVLDFRVQRVQLLHDGFLSLRGRLTDKLDKAKIITRE